MKKKEIRLETEEFNSISGISTLIKKKLKNKTLKKNVDEKEKSYRFDRE